MSITSALSVPPAVTTSLSVKLAPGASLKVNVTFELLVVSDRDAATMFTVSVGF